MYLFSSSVAVFLSWSQQLISGHERLLDISFIICFIEIFFFSFCFWRSPKIFSLSENPAILGCIAASGLLRKAASLAFTKHKRSTLTSDIIGCLGERYWFFKYWSFFIRESTKHFFWAFIYLLLSTVWRISALHLNLQNTRVGLAFHYTLMSVRNFNRCSCSLLFQYCSSQWLLWLWKITTQ